MTSGLERMKRNLDNTTWNKISDFHYELLKLRKTWRLKKVGGAILGDLSYKSGEWGWLVVNNGGLWWHLVGCGGIWWVVVAFGGLWWFMVG